MQPEDIDQLFRQRLHGHAPTPPADLWSRLEAELQPEPKKRPGLWLYSMAAAIALLLVAGAGWLLRSAPELGAGASVAASQPAATPAPTVAPHSPAASVKKALAQATVPAPAASTPSATRPAARPASASRPAPALVAATRPARRPPVATTPNPAPANASSEVAVVRLPAALPERTLASPDPAAPASALVASATPAASSPVPVGPIEVEVRRQAETPAALAAAAPTRRPRLGGIIRQVRNAVRGDQVNLADAGLPETLTVQARVAGRTLSKTIQL